MGKAFVHPGAHVQPQGIMSHSLDPSFFSCASTTASFMCKLKNMLTCFLMPTETLKIYVENAAILFMSAEK